MDERSTTESSMAESPTAKRKVSENNPLSGMDDQQQDSLRQTAKEHDPYKTVKNDIVRFFVEEGLCSEENCKIKLMEKQESGANLHFILEVEDDQLPKKFHIKSVSNQQSVVGVKYNELLAYKILEEYGCGPKMMFTVMQLPDDIKGYHHGVAERGTNVMVITEDLSNPHPDHRDKTFYFSTKKQAADRKRITGDDQEMQFYTGVSLQDEDNVQRCMIATIVNLLNLRDVTDNEGNIGLQYTIDQEGSVVTTKPYVIDFGIGYPSSVEKFHQTFWDDIIKVCVGSRTFEYTFSESCFTFTADDSIRAAVLQKIFETDDKSGNKAIDIIDSAVDSLVKELDPFVKEGSGFESLGDYCNNIKDRFSQFQRLSNDKLQEILSQKESSESNEIGNKPSVSPVPDDKGVSLTHGSTVMSGGATI